MFDEYKSGYECKDCKGTGKVHYLCDCEANGHPGFKNRFKDTECEKCNGNYSGARRKIQCKICKGFGNIIEIPQSAKTLPTTGIVVSMGPETPAMKIIRYFRYCHWFRFLDSFWHTKLKETPIRLGARVIFGPHIGTMIPFKGNIKLKIMRVHEPLAVLFGSDTGAKDFIDFESSDY